MAVAVTRRELSAAELRREAARSRDAKAARRTLATALVLEGRPRAEAAGTCGMDRQTLRLGRSASKGCTATTPRGSPGCRTAAPPARRRASRPRRRASWTVGSRRVRTRRATAWCAGAAATCGSGSGASSGSGSTSARSASCWGGSASGACRCGRGTPRATSPPRRRSGGLRRAGEGRASAATPWHAGRGLVHGRGPGRPAGHADARLGQARQPAAPTRRAIGATPGLGCSGRFVPRGAPARPWWCRR